MKNKTIKIPKYGSEESIPKDCIGYVIDSKYKGRETAELYFRSRSGKLIKIFFSISLNPKNKTYPETTGSFQVKAQLFTDSGYQPFFYLEHSGDEVNNFEFISDKDIDYSDFPYDTICNGILDKFYPNQNEEK